MTLFRFRFEEIKNWVAATRQKLQQQALPTDMHSIREARDTLKMEHEQYTQDMETKAEALRGLQTECQELGKNSERVNDISIAALSQDLQYALDESHARALAEHMKITEALVRLLLREMREWSLEQKKEIESAEFSESLGEAITQQSALMVLKENRASLWALKEKRLQEVWRECNDLKLTNLEGVPSLGKDELSALEGEVQEAERARDARCQEHIHRLQQQLAAKEYEEAAAKHKEWITTQLDSITAVFDKSTPVTALAAEKIKYQQESDDMRSKNSTMELELAEKWEKVVRLEAEGQCKSTPQSTQALSESLYAALKGRILACEKTIQERARRDLESASVDYIHSRQQHRQTLTDFSFGASLEDITELRSVMDALCINMRESAESGIERVRFLAVAAADVNVDDEVVSQIESKAEEVKRLHDEAINHLRERYETELKRRENEAAIETHRESMRSYRDVVDRQD